MPDEDRDPPSLQANLHRVMRAKKVRRSEVVKRAPDRKGATVYRVLAGTTTDPWTSTVVALCRSLEADPDELLGTTPPQLPPDLQELLDATQGLSEDDKWLVVDVLRAVMQRLR